MEVRNVLINFNSDIYLTAICRMFVQDSSWNHIAEEVKQSVIERYNM